LLHTAFSRCHFPICLTKSLLLTAEFSLRVILNLMINNWFKFFINLVNVACLASRAAKRGVAQAPSALPLVVTIHVDQ
jgi:hypothetical protein